jgi:hypothetical protein
MSSRRAPAIRAFLAISLVTLLPACSSSLTFGKSAVRMPGQASRDSADPAPAKAPTTPLVAEGFSAAEQERIAAVSNIVEREAKARGLDPNLVYGVIWVESRFNPKAKSPAGARGLMQLMPATAAHLAKELGEKRPHAYDPDFNIRAGAYYLDRLMDRFDGDETLAVAAYNAGPGNVSKWQKNGDDLPKYSQDYVGKVFAARDLFAGRPDVQTEAPMMKPQPSEVILVQRPMQQAEPEAQHEAIAQKEVEIIPEPILTFDEPVFEPAPELDAAPADGVSHHRVAVRDAGGRWPTRPADGQESSVPQVETQPEAPAAPKLPEQKENLPELELEALPSLDEPVGASSP